MKHKNCIIPNKRGCIYSGGGLISKALHQNISLLLKNAKAETVVNSPVFGRVLGPKIQGDAVKIGSFSSTLAKEPVQPISVNNIGDALKTISFKKKKSKNIKLEI